jgi:aspartate/glutamate racemase
MTDNENRNIIHIIHTSFVSVQDLSALFAELVPGAVLRHTVDDSLLAEVIAAGKVTPNVANRMCDYFKGAEIAGADLIFNQCSSVGEVADLASKMVNVPVIKVDQQMAETACNTGRRIGVVATLPSTLNPTCRLVESTASRLGKDIEIHRQLVAGAFDILVSGDRAQHNEMVINAIKELFTEVDVIVCAQGSMVAILPDLGETPVPVLTSPRSGVQSVADYLDKATN